ncbi:MAG: site-specific integrase [Frankiales bacterium]|nr:site-specific integrase [Frankiales bacterium]
MFGWVRALPSGRFQASYLGPNGARRVAPSTFATKGDADIWLTVVRASIIAGNWRDPEAGRQFFGQYAQTWIAQRPGLRPRTIDLYEWLYGRHLETTFSRVALEDMTPVLVRDWYHQLSVDGVSQSMRAKAYRLLRAVLNTAVDDGTIDRNPCRIRSGGKEGAGERPTLSIEQVFALCEAVPPRFATFIALKTFGSLRWGEITALRCSDVDLATGVLFVHAAWVERSTGAMELGPPKSPASIRAIALPLPVVDMLRQHLAAFVEDGPDPLIFTGPSGRPLRRSNFNKAVNWATAVASIGVPHLHLHDLRHTGNTLAAGTPGTSTRDLMERMGHETMTAALIYQHATRKADRRIAEALGVVIAESAPAPSGAVTAREQHATVGRSSVNPYRSAARPVLRGLRPGAGDENRTRTVSLGNLAFSAGNHLEVAKSGVLDDENTSGESP